MLEILKPKVAPTPETVVLQPELIVRASMTRCAPESSSTLEKVLNPGQSPYDVGLFILST